MIKNIWLKLMALTIFSALAATTHAAVVYSVTGPNPFGFSNQNPAAAGWSQSITYTNVSITVPLADLSTGGPISGTEGTVYLVNQIGSGTTSANNVAPPVTVSGLGTSFTPKLIFSGLTLGPGNYYIVWVSTSTGDLSMSMEGTSAASNTLGSGVTELGNSSASTPAAFPPATSGLSPLSTPNNYFITVTGTPSSAPVPALHTGGMILLAAALTLLALFTLRRMQP